MTGDRGINTLLGEERCTSSSLFQNVSLVYLLTHGTTMNVTLRH